MAETFVNKNGVRARWSLLPLRGRPPGGSPSKVASALTAGRSRAVARRLARMTSRLPGAGRLPTALVRGGPAPRPLRFRSGRHLASPSGVRDLGAATVITFRTGWPTIGRVQFRASQCYGHNVVDGIRGPASTDCAQGIVREDARPQRAPGAAGLALRRGHEPAPLGDGPEALSPRRPCPDHFSLTGIPSPDSRCLPDGVGGLGGGRHGPGGVTTTSPRGPSPGYRLALTRGSRRTGAGARRRGARRPRGTPRASTPSGASRPASRHTDRGCGRRTARRPQPSSAPARSAAPAADHGRPSACSS